MQIYIISKSDLKVKDVVRTISCEINEDASSAAQSAFVFASSVAAVPGDFVYSRGVYLGMVSGIEADKKTSVVTLRTLPVSSIFSRNILIGSAQIITENYIMSAINDNFVDSGDALLDIPYINDLH
jgi:hypothetical protein